MSRRGLQVLFLLVVLISACAPARAAASDAPFLWQVHGPKATHYLLGSIHLLPEGGELPAGIADAYDAAEGVVFETDIAAMDQPAATRALSSAGTAAKALKGQIGDRLYARLQRRAQRIHEASDVCDRLKAWLCAMKIEVLEFERAGFSPAEGIDKQVYRWAHEDGKAVRWFESPAAQLDLFTGMSDALSREFLASVLDEQAGDDDPAQLLRAWQDNDVAAIEKLDQQLKASYPGVYDRLFLSRNRSWMPTLKRLVDSGEPQLIVVGAAHLVGPDGLVAQLKARGYKVLPYIANESQLVTMQRPALVSTALHRR
jgi:uncharacterized protein YbaP (TraB family)